jgi:hypothetical protein
VSIITGRLYQVRKAFDAMTGRRTLADDFAGIEVEAIEIRGSDVLCERQDGRGYVWLHADRLAPISA